MNAMTLEQVRDWHRHQLNFLPESGVPTDLHQNAADAIDAHLAQPAQAVDVDYAPGELDSTAPERIWLQIDTNADNGDRSEPWPGTDGVTWQDESVGGLEIQYVRADLAASAISGEKAGPVDARSAALELIAEASESYKAPAHLTLSKAEYVKAGARHFINHLNSALAASPAPDKEAKP